MTPRRATLADLPFCAAIVNAWIDATPWMPRTDPVEEIVAAFDTALEQRELWVLGAPVAAYLSLNPDTGHIHGFYSSMPGAGLGKLLLDEAKRGRRFLSLNTHVPNIRAQAFYRREGFVKIGEHDPEPPDTIREMRMEWHRGLGWA